jgi:hypothetical protein
MLAPSLRSRAGSTLDYARILSSFSGSLLGRALSASRPAT